MYITNFLSILSISYSFLKFFSKNISFFQLIYVISIFFYLKNSNSYLKSSAMNKINNLLMLI